MRTAASRRHSGSHDPKTEEEEQILVKPTLRRQSLKQPSLDIPDMFTSSSILGEFCYSLVSSFIMSRRRLRVSGH